MVKGTQHTKKQFVMQSGGKTLKYWGGAPKKLNRGQTPIKQTPQEEFASIFPTKLKNNTI